MEYCEDQVLASRGLFCGKVWRHESTDEGIAWSVYEKDALAMAQAAKEELEQRQRADAKLRKEASHSAGA